MHIPAVTAIVLAAHFTPVVAIAQVQCPRCKGPNGNSCHCEPGGALVFGQGSSSSGSSSSSSARLSEQIRATDDYIARNNASLEQFRAEQDAKLAQWRREDESRRNRPSPLNDFYANQRAQQNSLIGTYNDHIGGIITRDMFADDEVYVEEPMWTGGTYWPAGEYVANAEAQAIRDRRNQRDAFLQTIRARNVQAEIDARHEQSRREAEYQRQMEAEKRRLFFSKRDSQAAVLKTLIGTDPAMVSGAGPSTLALLAGPQTAAAALPARKLDEYLVPSIPPGAGERLPDWTPPRTDGIEPLRNSGQAFLQSLGAFPPLPPPVKDSADWVTGELVGAGVEKAAERLGRTAANLASKGLILVDIVTPSKELANDDPEIQRRRKATFDADLAREREKSLRKLDILEIIPLPPQSPKPAQTPERQTP